MSRLGKFNQMTVDATFTLDKEGLRVNKALYCWCQSETSPRRHLYSTLKS